MLKTLSSRLIITYLAVIVLALLLASAALLVQGIQYKRADAYSRMASTLYFIMPVVRGKAGTLQNPDAVAQQINDALLPQLQTNNLRLFILSNSGAVLYDSNTATDKGAITSFDLAAATQPDSRPLLQGNLLDGDNKQWMFVAAAPRELRRPSDGASPDQGAKAVFYVAMAQRSPNFLEVWQDLRRELPLAAALGLVVALLLGGLLARSITRPLAHITAATKRMVGGAYNQQVPVEGSSEFVSLAQSFNAMAAEVEGSRRLQRDFLANVSHDLKTPLTSIQGFSQAMLDGAIQDPAGYAAAAQVINDEALRMGNLVNDLLDLARIQSVDSGAKRQLASLAPMLEQAVSGMQPQANKLQVTLKSSLNEMPPVLADSEQLRRAVTNLIDNALRHTPPHGVVTVRGDSASGAVRITVSDTGEGIPASDLPHIFERFYQIDKSRAAKGSSGLGLAIVNEIVTAHGGKITVQSQVGHGADFSITLPVPPTKLSRADTKTGESQLAIG